MAGPYDFHVMMRVEIEAALLNGSLAARDLLEVWREHMGTTWTRGTKRPGGLPGPLSSWLREAVWQHGRRYRRDELLGRATGRPLDLAPDIRHLSGRYLA